MKQKTLGIPLRCVDFSNSSQVVSVFTRDSGLLDALAKGSHREKNPFQGPFDLAVLYETVWLERRSASLALLTEASVVNGYRGVRRRWERYRACSHVLEFLRVVSVPGESSPELFDLTCATLEGIAVAGDAQAVEEILNRFDLRALGLLGLLGPAEACIRCQRAWLGSGRPAFYSVREGGIVCARCREVGGQPRGILVDGVTLRAINSGIAGRLSQAERVAPLAGREVGAVVARLRTNLLERELVLLESMARWT